MSRREPHKHSTFNKKECNKKKKAYNERWYEFVHDIQKNKQSWKCV